MCTHRKLILHYRPIINYEYKGDLSYGATDEFGLSTVENRVHVHDLHATILHLLGMDHEKLTYKYNGRRFRLTDVGGHVIQDILS
jgi:hypothetical protein